VTAGAHRLWTHRSYKATLPLKIFLALCNCLAAENSIYIWSRDHRVHHKYSETDADPHNAKRGFFFAHVRRRVIACFVLIVVALQIGWLMVKKHPDVIAKGAKIDLDDLHRDPVVMFQHKHYIPMTIVACVVLPTVIPHILWNDSLFVAYNVSILRYMAVLHVAWLVNSAAHFFGDKPYDVNIAPAENRLVSFCALGEGFHNYHHTFPQVQIGPLCMAIYIRLPLRITAPASGVGLST